MAYDPYWNGVYHGAHGEPVEPEEPVERGRVAGPRYYRRPGNWPPESATWTNDRKQAQELANAIEWGSEEEIRAHWGVLPRLRSLKAETLALILGQDLLLEMIEGGMDPNLMVEGEEEMPLLSAVVSAMSEPVTYYEVDIADLQDTVEALVGAGARVDLPSSTGRTVLHVLFSEYGDVLYEDGTGLVRWLVEAGADPNLQDGDGVTPVMEMIRGAPSEADALGMLRMLEVLGGVDALENAAGRTARTIAAGRGWRRVVEVLDRLGQAPGARGGKHAVRTRKGKRMARTRKGKHALRMGRTRRGKRLERTRKGRTSRKSLKRK